MMTAAPRIAPAPISAFAPIPRPDELLMTGGEGVRGDVADLEVVLDVTAIEDDADLGGLVHLWKYRRCRD